MPVLTLDLMNLSGPTTSNNQHTSHHHRFQKVHSRIQTPVPLQSRTLIENVLHLK